MSNDGLFRPCKCGNKEISVFRQGTHYTCICNTCQSSIDYEIPSGGYSLADMFEEITDLWNEKNA